MAVVSALPAQLRFRLARSLGNFNPQGAQNVLDEIFGSLSTENALSQVVIPYLEGLESATVRTASSVAHIQFATSLLETRLLALASGWESGGDPTVVIAYPGDEQHTFAGLAFGLVLRGRGWRIVHLGTGTPVQAAADIAHAANAELVVLVARDPAILAAIRDPLARLVSHRRLALAGAGATAALARDVGAEVLSPDPVAAATELTVRVRTPSPVGPRPGGPRPAARSATKSVQPRRVPALYSSE
ncbi:MAG TPA: hypothetical protein VGH45_01925 [Solirubrobacteraceae bacterium]|jgi:hypothetical protein